MQDSDLGEWEQVTVLASGRLLQTAWGVRLKPFRKVVLLWRISGIAKWY